jgi:hypothetical protein
VGQAQCFRLSTASISVLDYEHQRADQPVIAIWNACVEEKRDSASTPFEGDDVTVNRRAIDRWNNEGGRNPN